MTTDAATTPATATGAAGRRRLRATLRRAHPAVAWRAARRAAVDVVGARRLLGYRSRRRSGLRTDVGFVINDLDHARNTSAMDGAGEGARWRRADAPDPARPSASP
jgi:hypothetical protein